MNTLLSIHSYSISVGTVEPVYNRDHAKWLLYRGGLLIEVGGALVDGLILLAGI